jgi:hypothetical protein
MHTGHILSRVGAVRINFALFVVHLSEARLNKKKTEGKVRERAWEEEGDGKETHSKEDRTDRQSQT